MRQDIEVSILGSPESRELDWRETMVLKIGKKNFNSWNKITIFWNPLAAADTWNQLRNTENEYWVLCIGLYKTQLVCDVSN